MIVVDTAHGHTKKVSEIIRLIKKNKSKKTALCAGNVATAEAAKFLNKLGVDIIKVGIGPGSICTTRLVAGIGVPQLSAILEVRNGIKNKNLKIISDGGIKYSGDLAKAFAAGADAVMIGSLFSGTDETPGKLIKKNGSMGYLGSKQIKFLRDKPKFVKITKAGFYESMVHNVDIVKNDNKY